MDFIHSCEVTDVHGNVHVCDIHFETKTNSDLCSITVYDSTRRKFYKYISQQPIQYYKQQHDSDQLTVKYFEEGSNTSVLLLTQNKYIDEYIRESKEDSLIRLYERENELESELKIVRDNIRFVETLYPTSSVK
jgi:hypothetical protein